MADATTGTATIDQLIINSPYEEPKEHWKYHRETRVFTREPERRKAGYIRASESSRSFDDPGIFVELPLVNQIRPRIKAWREADYPGASGITKRLLQPSSTTKPTMPGESRPNHGPRACPAMRKRL